MQESAHVSVVQWKKSNSKGGGIPILCVFCVFVPMCSCMCLQVTFQRLDAALLGTFVFIFLPSFHVL